MCATSKKCNRFLSTKRIKITSETTEQLETVNKHKKVLKWDRKSDLSHGLESSAHSCFNLPLRTKEAIEKQTTMARN